MSLHTFIFDYGNVISTVDQVIFGQTVLPLIGCTLEELRDRLAGTRDLMVAYESGAMDSASFIEAFSGRLGLSITPEEFTTAWSAFFVPIPYTRALIRTLKPYGTLALLSNTNPLHFEHVIRTTDVFPLFDAVTLSYEVGVMKPAPGIYHDMLGKLQVTPAEAVYIDDLAENVEAAAALGMQAVHFTTPAEFHHRLLDLPLDDQVRTALQQFEPSSTL